jgi:vacuolar-type H+-ATPase subunit I/STV1
MNLFKKYRINPFIIIVFLLLLIITVNSSYSLLETKYEKYETLSEKIKRNNQQYKQLNRESERLERIQKRYEEQINNDKESNEDTFVMKKKLNQADIISYINKYSQEFNIKINTFAKTQNLEKVTTDNRINLKVESTFVGLVDFLFNIEVLNESVLIEKINIENTGKGLISSNLIIKY